MRAVALSDTAIQVHIQEHFIPLKVELSKGTPNLPLNWPALRKWSIIYKVMGGETTKGFTACTVVTPDLSMELANTGAANVWDLFRSTAYDRDKFLDMVTRASQREADRDQLLSTSSTHSRAYREWKRKIRASIANEGRGGLPPKGFNLPNMLELFRMSGDL
ncbi:MAG: hypothetical protein AAF191_02885 [Verrucomicrobiota bacterium]